MKLKINGDGIFSFFDDRGFTHAAIYGLGVNGRFLFDDLKNSNIKVDYCIDQNKSKIKIDAPLYDLSDELPETEVIIITPMLSFYDIKEKLEKKTSAPIYSIEEIVNCDSNIKF